MENIIERVQNAVFYYTAALLLIALLLVGLAIFLYGLVVWWRWRKREEDALKFVLLQIAIPKNNEVKIDAMEQIISSLSSIKTGGKFKFLKTQPHISLELVSTGGEIKFYISCHRKIKELVERQIHGGYSDAEIKEVEEHNIFNEKGKVVYSWLVAKKEEFYPLKTYKELPTDPISGITSAMAKLEQGEGAAVQILISPADSSWQKSGKRFISDTKKQEADPEKASFKVDARTLEAVETKCTKPGFETSIRIIVCAPDMEIAKARLGNIKSSFAQFDSPWNNLSSKKIRFKYSFMVDFIYRYQPVLWWGGRTVLNSEEIASMYHFPNKMIETPNIYWLKAKPAPPPANLPTSGIYLGKSSYRGMEKPVYIQDSDRQRHIYIIGKTGTGKSELQKEMIIQDINAGRGICLIDPHDLSEQILEYIPPERAEDVIYFDPSETERPMGLNLLEAETEDQKHFAATAVINLMYKLFDPYKTGIVGPRFEHAVRNAMLTAMYEPGATFMEVVKILQNPDGAYLRKILPKVKDTVVREYWTEQIAHTSDFHKSEVLDYIVSKFGRFVTNKMIRNIIGQSKSSFDFRKVMDEGKILIINLAKGKIGEENSSFLGLLLVPRILMAAMSRQDIPEEQRRNFYLYVDEFQNFATPDFAQILSEARKYHLNLAVANQFIGQIEEEVKNAIFGNTGTIISFRVGVSDANYLAREFQPVFSEEDLINVERFHAYIKTIVNGEPVTPFSMDTTKDMEEDKQRRNPKLAETIKRLSILKYGRPAEVVEKEIASRSQT
ncbi:MAG: DUF87 domain-containing protein [Patescibacteria group bacterium]